jgi:Family of unknown function (DUF6220)
MALDNMPTMKVRRVPRSWDTAYPRLGPVGGLDGLRVQRQSVRTRLHTQTIATEGTPAMSEHETAVDTEPTGARRAALAGYRWILLVFLILGVIQIFLAGYGAFTLNGGALGPAAFEAHKNLGFAMGGVTLLILLLAVAARAGRRAITLSILLVLLANVAQSLLASLGEQAPLIGGLHALDGLVIVGIAGFLHGKASRP